MFQYCSHIFQLVYIQACYGYVLHKKSCDIIRCPNFIPSPSALVLLPFHQHGPQTLVLKVLSLVLNPFSTSILIVVPYLVIIAVT